MHPKHSNLRTTKPASPGCRVQDTLLVSVWPNLKLTGSTSHLPGNCEKHSMTFIHLRGLFLTPPRFFKAGGICHSVLLHQLHGLGVLARV